MTKSMHTALQDLKLERLFVIHPGKDSYEMNDQTEAVTLVDSIRNCPNTESNDEV